MHESGHDGLRMERLFEVLLLTHWPRKQVYWSTKESIVFRESFQKFTDEFYRNLSQFGLVLYSETVIQCTGRSLASLIGIPLSPQETIRGEIIAAYRKHGLDVDLKIKDIEEMEVKRGEVFFSRRGS